MGKDSPPLVEGVDVMTTMESMRTRHEYHLLGMVNTLVTISMDALENKCTLTDIETADEVVQRLIPEWVYRNSDAEEVNKEVFAITQELVNAAWRRNYYDFGKYDAPNLIHWGNSVMGLLDVTFDEVQAEFNK